MDQPSRRPTTRPSAMIRHSRSDTTGHTTRKPVIRPATKLRLNARESSLIAVLSSHDLPQIITSALRQTSCEALDRRALVTCPTRDENGGLDGNLLAPLQTLFSRPAVRGRSGTPCSH